MANRFGLFSEERQVNGPTSVTFEKTGAQICSGIQNRQEVLARKNAEAETEIGAICANRELDPSEVVTADTEQAVETYTAKAYSSVGSQSTAIRAFEADLRRLQEAAFRIRSNKAEMEILARTSRNLEPARKFDLTYEELVRFGF